MKVYEKKTELWVVIRRGAGGSRHFKTPNHTWTDDIGNAQTYRKRQYAERARDFIGAGEVDFVSLTYRYQQ